MGYGDPESRVAAGHPLRLIRGIVNEVLVSPSAEFDRLYAPTGRPGIAPEMLLRRLVGLALDDALWDATLLRKTRDRLVAAEA